MKNKQIINYSIVIAIITAITLFIPFQENIIVQTLRIIFGSIFILLIPGFFLTLVFFKKNEIDLLERIALSFALSISTVPLLSFYVNLLGVPINELTVFIIICIIILLNMMYLSTKKYDDKYKV